MSTGIVEIKKPAQSSPLLPSKTSPIFKKEGTSQTYGQLVLFPSKRDGFQSTYQHGANTPQDIVVKLISNSGNGATLSIDDIDDDERSKISIAAFSENAVKSVPITVEAKVRATNERGQQEKVNIADVAANIEDYAIVVGSSFKTPQELKVILKDCSKLDMFVTLKSKFSEEIDFNNLKEKSVNAKFVYNFFTPQEGDIRTEEDQSQDPLLNNDSFNVPRYVSLTWDPIHITEPLSSYDSEIKAQQVHYKKVTGVVGSDSYSFKNSFFKSQKKTNLITINGRATEIIDIHGLDKAFNSIVNSTRFGNSINVTFSSIGSSLSINNIPVLGEVKKL